MSSLVILAASVFEISRRQMKMKTLPPPPRLSSAYVSYAGWCYSNNYFSWLRSPEVERRSVTGELFSSYARPAADG